MPFEFNFFVNVRGRAVAYNALLQGQFRHSAYTLDASQLNRAILEVETGAYFRYRKFSLMFQPIVLRTSETNLPQKRTHYWGTLYFAIGR
ncbi:MAG: lipid A-modifier LpxR family protein [Bacteroidota bacterium]